MVVRAALLILLSMIVTTPLHAQVRLKDYGISLIPAEEWELIPDSIISTVETDAIRLLGIDIDYVAGFQPEPGETWLELPYVLFQVVESRPISEEEFVEAMEGEALAAARTEAGERATGAGALDAASFGQPVWDAESHILWTRFTMSSPERGEFQGLTGQLLFRQGVLVLHYYFELDEPAQPVIESAEAVLLATAFDAGVEYSESAAAAARPAGFWSRVLEKGVFGAVAGGLLAGLLTLFGGLRKRGDTSRGQESSRASDSDGGGLRTDGKIDPD